MAIRQTQHNRWWPRLVAVLFFGALAGYFIVQGLDALPDPEGAQGITCGDKPMRPGDVCDVFGGSGSGEMSSYEKLRDAETKGDTVLLIVMFALAALSIFGVIWHTRKIRHARPVRTGPGPLTRHSAQRAERERERTELRAAQERERTARARMRDTTAIIGGVNPSLDRPAELVLGRYYARSGNFGVVATVAIDVPEEIAELIEPAGGQHPWGPTRPDRRFRADCVNLQPRLVAEIRVDPDTATKHGRWQRVEFLGLRHDLEPAQVPTGLKLTTEEGQSTH